MNEIMEWQFSNYFIKRKLKKLVNKQHKLINMALL